MNRKGCAMAAAVLIVGAITLGCVGNAARAASTGELVAGEIIMRGWWAGALPPVRIIDGRRIVLVSARDSEYLVRFGPFENGADCSSSMSEYMHGSLSEKVYERFKSGHARADDEDRILADVQKRNSKCIQSDGSEQFRMPGTFKADNTTDFVK
jgi:hypothetical protein